MVWEEVGVVVVVGLVVVVCVVVGLHSQRQGASGEQVSLLLLPQ